MHFVKKVPTTEEERAVREKERRLKMIAFSTARDRIFQKRAKGERDVEMLSITQKVLEKNPDIYTFWNIRRDVIENLWCELLKEDENGASEKFARLLDTELHITQTCIEANPKSYSAWFQRGWVLRKHPSPNFKLDLALCEKALKADCRNFHCWDHRRVVAKLADLPAEEELKFSNSLIAHNFSNYSAWHYRATLFPRLHGTGGDDFSLPDDVLATELKKIMSAFFTDPDDQSAWVYSRWLIEMGSWKTQFEAYGCSPAVPVSVTFHENHYTIVMSKPCTSEIASTFLDTKDEGVWKGICHLSPNPNVCRVWNFISSAPVSVRPDISSEKISSAVPYVNKRLLNVFYDLSVRPSSPAIESVMKNCRELIEMEPKNVWALYILTLCLMEVNPVSEHENIIANLEKLANELDTMRKQQYLALRNRQLIAAHLRSVSEEGQTVLDSLLSGDGSLRMAGLKLTSVDALEMLAGFITNLDLSENCLSEIDSIMVLPNLDSLTLQANNISKLSTRTLSNLSGLTFLSVAGCPLEELDDTVSALENLPSLERFLFAESGLSDKANELRASLPDRNIRLIPHWL